jgi:pyruvate dehydrogenase E2 component (dihydrolipoamide acetyltransferase)
VSFELTKSKGGSVFRKIAMGSWRTAGDPSVYGLLEIDVSKALQYLEQLQKQTSVKVTISHLVGKATAIALKQRPEINGLIRFARIYQRKHVDLFYQINVPGDPNDPVGKAKLSGEVVRKAETLSAVQIAEELNQRASHLKKGGEGELSKSMDMMKLIPWSMMYWALKFSAFLTYGLGLNLKFLGIPRDPFGSVMITNIGSIGVDLAWAPLVPYTRVPLLLTVGAIKDRAWVVNGKVEVRPVMRVGITFDHRFMDGIHASVLNKIFIQCFEEPEKYFA